LLVSSQETTRPFSEVAFSLLKEHLAMFHADYDAKLRNEILGLTKNLIRRVKNIITVAERAIAAADQKAQLLASGAPAVGGGAQPPNKKRTGPKTAQLSGAEAKEVMDRHQAFLDWYMSFLQGELIPTASYQRHITALRATLLAIKVGKHAGATDDSVDTDVIGLMSSGFTWVRLLLDLMIDPFDDVRETACMVLSLFPQEIVSAPVRGVSGSASVTLLDVLKEFCLRARALADRTGRADHGDGAARSQGLLCTWLNEQTLQLGLVSSIIEGLEGKIAKAEQDLGHAAIENPVHPDFAAIR